MSQVYNNTYRFERRLGEGGFGVVVCAREEISQRFVAIKTLHSKSEDDQADIRHEIMMVGKLNHPNIITYHHQFTENSALNLVMEYCAGGSLQDLMSSEKVNEADALRWVGIAAEALAFAHLKGIFHHDIKPANLLLTEEKILKVSDFGIANTGGGTRAYMCPEALLSMDEFVLDARVDVYSLGVTLMQLLTGQNPFIGLAAEAILALHDRGDFPIRKLPVWQQEIILKAINKVPELRFQTMQAFAAAIKAQQVSQPTFIRDHLCPSVVNSDYLVPSSVSLSHLSTLNPFPSRPFAPFSV